MGCQTKILLQSTVFHETLFRHDNNLNHNIDDLDCPPPLTRPSKGDIEEVLDKLQDLSLFSSYGDKISPLTLKIEALLNKERTEGLKQSHLTDFFQTAN